MEIKLRGWIARDHWTDGDPEIGGVPMGSLWLYAERPRRDSEGFGCWWGDEIVQLDRELFPELSHDDEPIEAEILVIPKNQ